MQNCPRQLAMQSCVRCGTSNQIEKRRKKEDTSGVTIIVYVYMYGWYVCMYVCVYGICGMYACMDGKCVYIFHIVVHNFYLYIYNRVKRVC